MTNSTKMQKYSGLKYAGGEEEVLGLAEMLRLGVLPAGYIYPKEGRPIRDLLPKGAHLGRMQTSALLRLKNILSRNLGGRGKGVWKRVGARRVCGVDYCGVRIWPLQVRKVISQEAVKNFDIGGARFWGITPSLVNPYARMEPLTI